MARAPVLADSAYGDSTDFREALRALRCEFFLQVSGVGHKAWSEPVVTERKTKRYHVAASTPPARTLNTGDCGWIQGGRLEGLPVESGRWSHPSDPLGLASSLPEA